MHAFLKNNARRALLGAAFFGGISLAHAEFNYRVHVKNLRASPVSCVAPWGAPVANQGTVTAYQANTVPLGQLCASEIRTCENGKLSGSYSQETCTPEQLPAGFYALNNLAYSSVLSANMVTHTAAAAYCASYTGLGGSGWRLGSPAELLALASNLTQLGFPSRTGTAARIWSNYTYSVRYAGDYAAFTYVLESGAWTYSGARPYSADAYILCVKPL